MKLLFLILSNTLFISTKTEALSTTIIVDILKTCPNNNQLIHKFTNFTFHNERGKVIVSYFAKLNETLNGPLEIKVEGERCNLEKTQCTSMPGISYPDLCAISKVSYYSKAYFSKIQPSVLKCPIKPVGFIEIL